MANWKWGFASGAALLTIMPAKGWKKKAILYNLSRPQPLSRHATMHRP